MSGSNDQPQQPDLNAAIQALIRQQVLAASGQGQQVQLPSATPPPSQYSNDPDKGPDLISRIGLALGGGSLPGAPAELRQQMGRQALMNFGIGLMSAPWNATLGQQFAGGLQGARSGLLGSEAALAGQQEYALNAQAKLAELGLAQQKNRTDALAALVPLMQLSGRLGQPLFGGGGPGGPGGGPQLADISRDTDVETAGQQANNPGNIMADGNASFPGANGRIPVSGGRHVMSFPDVPTGVAASAANLASYAASGINTIRGAVTRWVGDPKADLTSYINDVSKAVGVSPDQPVDLTNPAVQRAFIIAQQPHETGGKAQWLKPADVDAGIQLAQQRRQGAPPPAGGPGSAPQGPIKPPAASTAAAAPPGVQMGGPPPAPPGGAPGAYSGGGIGTALNPPPPGMERTPSGGLVTKGGGAFPGTRADADAILQGIQTAQATPVVRGTGEEAGPSGAVATLAQPQPQPQPGWGAQVGSYNNAPVGPVTAKAAPAVTPPAPAPTEATPPASAPSGAPPPTPQPRDLASTPDTELRSPEEYMQKHWTPLTPEQVATYAPGPTGEAAVTAAKNVQDARANLAAMQRVADEAHRGLLGQADINRADENVNKAQEALAARQSAYDTQVQELAKAGATNLLNADEQQRQQLRKDYQDIVIGPRNKAAELAQQGATQETIERIKTGADLQRTLMAPDLDRLKQMGTQAGEMNSLSVNLQQLRPILRDLPQAGWGAAIAQHLSPEAMGWMQAAGMGDPKTWNAIQALNGLAGYISSQMRPVGSGPLRTQEMNRFMQALPGLSQNEAGREKALAFLLNYSDRIQDENQFANEYFHRQKPDGSGEALNLIGVDRAMNGPKSQGGLGEVVPHGPPISQGTQAAQTFLNGIDSGRPYYAWVPKVDENGKPVRNERGGIVYDYDLAVKP